MAQNRMRKAVKANSQVRSERRMEHATNRMYLRIFTFIILVTIAFVAGFALRSNTALVASWGIPLTATEEEVLQAVSKTENSDSISTRVAEVEDILQTYSMDEIDVTDATYTMLDDLMKSTGDSYAAYYNPENYNAYIKETTDGGYAGIGVLFADYQGRAYVIDVFEGSEAEAKGVQQGDLINMIDNTDTTSWSMSQVVTALSRDDGENVTITWMHPASTDAQTGTAFTTQLECKVYDEANVTTSLSDKVGVVKLRQITQNASSLVQEAVTSLVDQGAEALVLDLRDNPGGYLTQAVNISSLFVSSGVLVQITSKDGPQTEKSATGKASFPGIPVVVLVNKYTSAAAEVLTASLQGNNRAEVYGETTRGKASVQVVRELKFGGAVRYTAAYYLTPSGEPIDGVGVSPNTAVAQSESTADTQLLAAESEARSQIASE